MTTTSKTATHRRQNGKANSRVHGKAQHKSKARVNGSTHGKPHHKTTGKTNGKVIGKVIGEVGGATPVALPATVDVAEVNAREAVVVEATVAEPVVPMTGTPEIIAEAPAPAPAATTPAPVATEEEPPPPPEEPAPGTPSTQRMEYRVLLTESRAIIAGLAAPNDALAPLLVELKIGPERLAACTSLCDAVEAALSERQEAMSAEKTAVKNMNNARRLLEVAYATFRQVARTVYPDSVRDADARRALGLDMPIVDPMPIFANLAREALTAAQREPYATQLAAANFDADRIEATLALVTVLEMLIQARQLAHRVALDATITRDATVPELRRAMRQIKLDVQSILRTHPEVNPPANFS